MAFEIRDNTGSLFVNERKDSPSHPDRTGTIKVTEPGEYRVAGWIKEGKDGKKPWLSLGRTRVPSVNSASAVNRARSMCRWAGRPSATSGELPT